MCFFTSTWAPNFERILCIANIINFSICPGDANYRKIYTFYKVSCVLLVSVMARPIESPFKNLIDISGRLKSENFTDMLKCFLSSMACTSCFGQSEVSFSKKPFTKGVNSVTTYNYIHNQKFLKVTRFTFGT